ncbi:Ribosomal protein S18 [Raphanus sativus]|uniref:Small ribosomal subunit protein bS18c n=1 Tax=Raphanus sativus TaxID=3726 RepID=A0A6J0NYM1_RAPSA|nr:uncharacterized protein LOC108859989 isoform X2 [Raphanus sativus]KAJ4895405.1 Ribosomal protein S18 [Raphanus sativus]
MKLAHSAIRSINDVASSLRPCRPFVSRSLSTNNPNQDPIKNRSPFDSSSSDDWMFGGGQTDNDTSGFFQHLGKAEKDKRDYTGLSRPPQRNGSRFSSSRGSVNRDETFEPSSDGVDGKLKKAALIYNVDDDEGGVKDGYSFRPDVNHFPRDINYRRQMQKPRLNNKAEMLTTEDVLKKADFRNVRFLAQFITEAGILVKRKQTGISAKAQRKIAREIKTARAFGLMPFTTMGTKAFTFGKTMENRDQDFEYEVVDDDDEYDDNTPE